MKNGLCRLFAGVNDGDTLTLEKGKIYHIRPEDSYDLKGYYVSNTANTSEKPLGQRNTAMLLQNKKNVTIDGNGAVVMVHGKMTPFLFDRCENVTVRDLTVDYACPTMTEFTVLSNEDGVCLLRFNPDNRFRIDGNTLYFRGEDGPDGAPYWEQESDAGNRFVRIYDPAAKLCRGIGSDQLSFTEIEQTDELTIRVRLKYPDADYVPGYVFQSRNIIRDQTGGLFQRCKNLELLRLRVKFMHGLGIVSQFCENVAFRDCDLTPGEGRTGASTADFFQFSGCRGKLIVENCVARGAHDDYINVHGTHLQITELSGDCRSMTVRFMHDQTWGMQAYEIGDRLEFIRWDTLRPYGEAVVTAFERLNGSDIRLTLDRPAPEGVIVGKDVVENATWTPDLYVHGCDFGPTHGRGVLCTTRGEVIVENNRFYHLSCSPLVVEDDCNFWFESGYTTHVIFRNNEVIGCNSMLNYIDAPVIRYSPKVMNENSREFVHGKLTLTGNTFRESYTGRHTVRLEYLENAEILDNTFDAPLMISAKMCGDVRLEGNHTPKNCQETG
ncbi:MAG: hypothetical protein K6G90_01660 [Clostridia bacterium]|nr:hypothetical protein [Clostridia bacterium]